MKKKRDSLAERVLQVQNIHVETIYDDVFEDLMIELAPYRYND